jgi:hypothetical protein
VQITIDTAAVAALAGIVTGAGGALVTTWQRWRKPLQGIRLLAEDWHGEPDRPGVPGRPGVMVRLASIEGELRTNGGQSLRDSVARTEAAVQAHLAAAHGVVLTVPASSVATLNHHHEGEAA